MAWSINDNLTTESTIISEWWYMAVKSNVIIEEIIFHSERASQYTSYTFTNIIKSYDDLVKQSLNRKGNYWDNAVADFFLKLKKGMGV